MALPRCPRCGSELVTGGRVAWCSSAGEQRTGGPPGCIFGIDSRVLVGDITGPPKEPVGDWGGAATDLLKEHSLDEAADCFPRYARAVELLEAIAALDESWDSGSDMDKDVFAFLAEVRGEFPEQTRYRLR